MTAGHQLFFQDLKRHIQGDVLTDDLSLGIYATDASVYQIKPVAVVLPKHEADVRTAIQIAGDHRVPILPRGGGTSLAGQTVGNALVLDFSKYMNHVLEFNEAERWVRVQPGKVRDELNNWLQPYGLHFAPDPATSSRANIGGMIGNNSSGTKSILFGKTVDHVLELRVALADGTILQLEALSREAYQSKAGKEDREGLIYRNFRNIVLKNEAEIRNRFPKVMRRVQGYNLDEFAGSDTWNLCKLITGSEGTLATVLEAKLKLEPLPKYKSVCVVHFDELSEAIRAVNPMLLFRPSAVEILDKTVLDLSRKNLTTQRSCHFLEGDPVAIQIAEFYGDSPEEVMERPRQMIRRLRDLGLGYAFPLFPEGPDYEDVWTIRKKGLGLMLGIKGDKKPLAFIEDAGIPTEVLPEYIEKVLAICKKHHTQAAMYAHASVGVIHVRPILDLRQAEDIERFTRISEETYRLVKAYGGSWSGEHGDGLVRSHYLKDYFGEQVYNALREVKQLFDPENRMNPGKIIDAPPIDQHLRYGTTYKDEVIDSVFHYREDGSFEKAVHMCTGVGECRKVKGGTMCPSFKATREEAHSTRGRANALRLAMSGQLGPEGLSGQALHEVLDLCLSCKACKSECPSNVDMARLKSEVWQKRYDRYGTTLRDRLIRDSADVAARISGPAAPIVNFVQGSRLFREAMHSLADIDRRRTLPAYARESFSHWHHKHDQSVPENKKKVVLFADTYLNYHEPEVGVAATRLLQTLGYEVILADAGCCQRPKISHGFLKKAKREGAATANKLDPFLRQGLPVLVCEPSCASALIDDLPDLLDDDALAQRLSKGVQMIDLFLYHELEQGRLTTEALAPKFDQLFIHGHCHQKAYFGTEAMKTMLETKGAKVEEIPSGCCGMAGSFGYEQEHYELSEKIGEEILFPAIRNIPAETPLIACGFSCRHQIEHFTGREAIHWVQAWMESQA